MGQDRGRSAANPLLSVDPLAAAYPWYTPYQFAGDMPIWAADLDGLEPDFKGSSAGQTEITSEQGSGDVYAWSWTGSEWRRGLKEVTIKSSKKDNGVGFRISKVEYSDSDYDNYSASSDYSSRDWKTAVNAGVNVANMGIDALRAVVCLPQTIMSVTQKGYQLLSWSVKPAPLKGMDIYAWGGTTLSGINSSIGDPNVGDQVLTFGLLTGMALPAGGGIAAGEAGLTASGGIAEARALGVAGEEALGVSSKTRIPSLTGTAKYRIPDILTKTTLGEVKNVSHLSLTRQVVDFHLHSQKFGLDFILYTRPSTTFSGPLQNLINNGSIIVKTIPFK